MNYIVRVELQKPAHRHGYLVVPRNASSIKVAGKAIIFSIPGGPEFLGRACGLCKHSDAPCVSISLTNDDTPSLLDFVFSLGGTVVTEALSSKEFRNIERDFVCGDDDFEAGTVAAFELGFRAAAGGRKHRILQDDFFASVAPARNQWRDISRLPFLQRTPLEKLYAAWNDGALAAYTED